MDTFSTTVFSRVSVENQVLKSGYTSRDLIILENDDPGGVFEFSPASRGPYIIKVSMKETLISLYSQPQKSNFKGFELLWTFFPILYMVLYWQEHSHHHYYWYNHIDNI